MENFENESLEKIRERMAGAGVRTEREAGARKRPSPARAAGVTPGQLAAALDEVHGAITENTDTMLDMSAAVEGAAARVENASNEVYDRVEARAVETLEGIDRAARAALESSMRAAYEAAAELESVRRASVSSMAAACAASAAVSAAVLLAAIGAMWLQLEAGATWLSRLGWAAIPLSMAASGVVGAMAARAKGRR